MWCSASPPRLRLMSGLSNLHIVPTHTSHSIPFRSTQASLVTHNQRTSKSWPIVPPWLSKKIGFSEVACPCDALLSVAPVQKFIFGCRVFPSLSRKFEWLFFVQSVWNAVLNFLLRPYLSIERTQGCYFTLSTRLRKHVFVSHHGTLGETLQPMQCGQLISMLILLATASQSFKITREERLDHICYVRQQISFLLSDLVAVAQAYID